MINEINLNELQHKAFNALLPYINKYSVYICDELFKYFDKNIKLKDSDGFLLKKKLIGFNIEFSEKFNTYYINDKFSLNNKEHYNTLACYRIDVESWCFFWANITLIERLDICNFILLTLVRRIKINSIFN